MPPGACLTATNQTPRRPCASLTHTTTPNLSGRALQDATSLIQPHRKRINATHLPFSNEPCLAQTHPTKKDAPAFPNWTKPLSTLRSCPLLAMPALPITTKPRLCGPAKPNSTHLARSNLNFANLPRLAKPSRDTLHCTAPNLPHPNIPHHVTPGHAVLVDPTAPAVAHLAMREQTETVLAILPTLPHLATTNLAIPAQRHLASSDRVPTCQASPACPFTRSHEQTRPSAGLTGPVLSCPVPA